MRGVLVRAAWVAALSAPAAAQTPALSAAPAAPAAPTMVCSKADLSQPMTAQQIEMARNCLELQRLQSEAQAAASPRPAASPAASGEFIELFHTQTGFTALATIIVAALGLLAACLGVLLKHLTERSLLNMQKSMERASARQAHVNTLLDQLTERAPIRQTLAVAGLMRHIGELCDLRRRKHYRPVENELDPRALVRVLLARLRDPELDPGVVKYVGDNLLSVFKAQRGRKAEFKLSEFDLQHVRLADAYWKQVDASHTDFFKADLTNASLREADLRGAVFYQARLVNTVLVNARLSEAEFRGADLSGANLRGADLSHAKNLDAAIFSPETGWDAATRWPSGFDPASHGLGPMRAQAA